MDHLCYFCLVLICFHARLFVNALWSLAGKGLTSWLPFVMLNCNVVTFPSVSWVRCGARLYRFLIFAFFLILGNCTIGMTTSHFCIFLLVGINWSLKKDNWTHCSRGCFMGNLKYDWLMLMSLGGAVVSFYHVTLSLVR